MEYKAIIPPDERPSLCPNHVGYFDTYAVWRIEDGETHWCVAESRDEALRSQGVDTLDYGSVNEYLSDCGPVMCSQVNWWEDITVSFECDRNGESVGVVKKVRKARDWAVDYRGVFCSTTW